MTLCSAACLCYVASSLIFCCNQAAGRTYEGVLQNPVALGAWLYAGTCLSCHDGYEKDRPAEKYDDHDELVSAIASGGCRVTWARSAGGTLGVNELEALATYMQKWEEGGEEPALPELPPQPVKQAPEPLSVALNIPSPMQIPAVKVKETLNPALSKLVATNTVAAGGWIYTRNCYRCHLSYRQTRQAKGMDKEILQRTISEGKTSTQMKAFSRLLGGDLKSSEIRAIVSYIITWEAKGEDLALAEELMTPPAVDPADFVPVRLPRFQLIAGNPNAGKTVFIKNCIACHGTVGEGYMGRSLQERKWVVRPDLLIKSTIKQGIPGSLMKSWAGGSAGNLSAKDIDDLVALIVTWSDPS